MLTYIMQVDGPIDDLGYWAARPDQYEYEHWLPVREVFGQPSGA